MFAYIKSLYVRIRNAVASVFAAAAYAAIDNVFIGSQVKGLKRWMYFAKGFVAFAAYCLLLVALGYLFSNTVGALCLYLLGNVLGFIVALALEIIFALDFFTVVVYQITLKRTLAFLGALASHVGAAAPAAA